MAATCVKLVLFLWLKNWNKVCFFYSSINRCFAGFGINSWRRFKSIQIKQLIWQCPKVEASRRKWHHIAPCVCCSSDLFCSFFFLFWNAGRSWHTFCLALSTEQRWSCCLRSPSSSSVLTAASLFWFKCSKISLSKINLCKNSQYPVLINMVMWWVWDLL